MTMRTFEQLNLPILYLGVYAFDISPVELFFS